MCWLCNVRSLQFADEERERASEVEGRAADPVVPAASPLKATMFDTCAPVPSAQPEGIPDWLTDRDLPS